MKMGLGLVLVGHVNFLLGALVHGAVLRHINVHAQARSLVYATSNIIAIVAGLMVSGSTEELRSNLVSLLRLSQRLHVKMDYEVQLPPTVQKYSGNILDTNAAILVIRSPEAVSQFRGCSLRRTHSNLPTKTASFVAHVGYDI